MTKPTEPSAPAHPQPYWSTKPGELVSTSCPVCGETCDIERNLVGPTGFAEALAGRASLHDRIVCPYADTAWHDRATRLQGEIAQTSSRRLAANMGGELRALVREKRRPRGSG